jgi:hypothetical protein
VQVHRHGQGPRLLQAARIDDTHTAQTEGRGGEGIAMRWPLGREGRGLAG